MDAANSCEWHHQPALCCCGFAALRTWSDLLRVKQQLYWALSSFFSIDSRCTSCGHDSHWNSIAYQLVLYGHSIKQMCEAWSTNDDSDMVSMNCWLLVTLEPDVSSSIRLSPADEILFGMWSAHFIHRMPVIHVNSDFIASTSFWMKFCFLKEFQEMKRSRCLIRENINQI